MCKEILDPSWDMMESPLSELGSKPGMFHFSFTPMHLLPSLDPSGRWIAVHTGPFVARNHRFCPADGSASSCCSASGDRGRKRFSERVQLRPSGSSQPFHWWGGLSEKRRKAGPGKETSRASRNKPGEAMVEANGNSPPHRSPACFFAWETSSRS